jgi:glyceraldehyde 3-phosphate dehydrogenase
MKKRIAINGFGRIGRAAARIILQDYSDHLDLVAINDPSPAEMTRHLFQFDTNFGTYPQPIEIQGENLVVGGKSIRNFNTRNIEDLPWKELEIDIVLECTGVFRTTETAGKHLSQGAKKLLLSAPAKSDGFTTVVLGVNENILTGEETLISNASCTTNCLAPVAKVLHESFGIVSGVMTTVHSYTNDQRILDVGHKDLRRARAAAENIIPTSTGAAKAVGLVLPELNRKLNGLSIRVPTPTVSLVDLVVKVEKSVTAESVNQALESFSKNNPHIMGFETRPLVSTDFKGDARSSIVDSEQTMVIDDLVKVLAWYDNEWGYSCRLVELANQL